MDVRYRLTRKRVVLLVGLVMLFTAGGIAYATIPDASGVIHGCYVRSTGALKVIDSGKGQACNSEQQALNWNQTGPSGLQGATGPSDVYFTGGSATNSLPVAVGFPGQYTIVASLSVPAGTYLLDASPFVRNDDATTSAFARCIMFVNGQSAKAAVVTLEPSQGGGQYFGNVALRTVRTLSSGGTVSVGCQKSDAATDPGYGSSLVFAEGNFLMAQLIGAGHEQ
jgi:hypothetical protein